MKVTFLGTRGYIGESNRRHRRHSSLLVTVRGHRLMIDCGADWRNRLSKVDPDTVFITHAHPDHACGLKDGASCPVYATADTWKALRTYPIADRRVIRLRSPVESGGMTLEAFSVVHSLRAPAVGFRITAGRTVLFYVPDVVDIDDRAAALAGAQLYLGDGATLTRPMVRRHDGQLFGHTTVRAQLGWCQAARIPRAIFTHCGSEIVTGDERTIRARLRALALDRQVEATIAYDGLELTLR